MNAPPEARERYYPRYLTEIAGTLLDLSRKVEALGSRLCADPEVVASHARDMQLFDLVSQMHNELAVLLTAECPACATANLQLEALRERMQASLPHVHCCC